MHGLMVILVALFIAILRFFPQPGGRKRDWTDRWCQSLGRFLLPPLLVLTTVTALVLMGPRGQMVAVSEGWLIYGLALGLSGGVSILLLKQLWQGSWELQQIRRYALVQLGNQEARILPCQALFAAQVGFWQPQLLISQGALDVLAPDQLTAVLMHEQAHRHYRDTFWFFWLGWIRLWSSWIPGTEPLWQELLLLRELRADQWAAQHVDPLTLAEALFQIVQNLSQYPSLTPVAEIRGSETPSRLNERIELLLENPLPLAPIRWANRMWWLGLSILPLLIAPFHY